jgi:hypothetical protein
MPRQHKAQSSGLSPWLYAKGNFRDSLMLPWLKTQSQIPLTQWLQPSEKTEEKTHTGTQNATLGDFYRDN